MKIDSKKGISQKDNCDGYFIDANEKETRKIVEFLKGSKEKKKIAVKAIDENFNRRVIETLDLDYLVSPEINSERDNLKQRSSGLNHVLAKKMAKKKISVLISLKELEKVDKEHKAFLIARIIQNVKLCRKANCAIKIASLSERKFFSKKQRELVGESWGMSSQQVKQSCLF